MYKHHTDSIKFKTDDAIRTGIRRQAAARRGLAAAPLNGLPDIQATKLGLYFQMFPMSRFLPSFRFHRSGSSSCC
jgi:hypothetical protein